MADVEGGRHRGEVVWGETVVAERGGVDCIVAFSDAVLEGGGLVGFMEGGVGGFTRQ